MEGKYGRLFTETDLAVIAQHVHGELTMPQVIEKLDRLGVLTFSAGEPLFLLRGQDAAAPDAIASGWPVFEETGRSSRDYVQTCLNVGAPRGHVEAIWKAAAAMRDWQRAHPDRVKIPD